MTKRKEKSGKIAGFISKLIEILKNKENEGIIFYNDQERSFTIKNIRKFTEEILPKYFKHKNYSSFVRQVNLYSFHKMRHEGKQQEYRQEFFDIMNLKQLKKIKRKPMGSQKTSNQRRDRNKSEVSESDEDQMEEEFMDDESQHQKSDHSESGIKKQEINIQLQDLQRKKLFLQNKIRLQQMANEKLQTENSKLKTVLNSQNSQFYADLLKILENLMISQFNQGQITRQIYDKIVRHIYFEREILQTAEKQNRIGKTKYFKESKFLKLVKELIVVKRGILTIPYFIQRMLHFIETEESSQSQNPNSDMDVIPDPLFVNYDPYYISKQNSRASNRLKNQMEQQKKQGSQKIALSQQERMKSQSKESSRVKFRRQKSLNNIHERTKMKKRHSKKEKDSEDEEYVPKNHR